MSNVLQVRQDPSRRSSKSDGYDLRGYYRRGYEKPGGGYEDGSSYGAKDGHWERSTGTSKGMLASHPTIVTINVDQAIPAANKEKTSNKNFGFSYGQPLDSNRRIEYQPPETKWPGKRNDRGQSENTYNMDKTRNPISRRRHSHPHVQDDKGYQYWYDTTARSLKDQPRTSESDKKAHKASSRPRTEISPSDEPVRRHSQPTSRHRNSLDQSHEYRKWERSSRRGSKDIWPSGSPPKQVRFVEDVEIFSASYTDPKRKQRNSPR